MTEPTELFTVGELYEAIDQPWVTVTVNTPSIFGFVVEAKKSSVLWQLKHMDAARELDSSALHWVRWVNGRVEHTIAI